MRFPKIALAAVAVALIATMAVAEAHPTNAVSNPEKRQPHLAVDPPHARAPPKKQPVHTTTKAKVKKTKTTTKPKKTTTKAKKPTKTTKAKKPTKTTTKVKPTKVKTTSKPVKPTKTKNTTSPMPTPTKPSQLGQTGVVLSQKDFCLWLPPGKDLLQSDNVTQFT